MTVHIIQADARRLPLADDSVDLIVTSPPYWALRSYQDKGEHYDGQIGAEATPAAYIDNLIDCTREWLRVLKPGGSLFVNLGDKYAGVGIGTTSGHKNGSINASSYDRHVGQGRTTRNEGVQQKSLIGLPWRYALRCVDELGLILRAEVIWSKPNGLPESVTDRVRRSHEQWFHFTLRPRYFSAIDEIRIPTVVRPGAMNWAQRKTAGEPPRRGEQSANDATVNGMAPHALGALPGSVWEIATQPLKVPADLGIDHYAAFPIEWPRRIIAAWCPPEGIVLDPFGGTGTTALCADVAGRVGISVDASADYCRIAHWRTSDPGERARAMGVPRPAPEMDGQTSLLDHLGAA